jgi:hypothetical protein
MQNGVTAIQFFFLWTVAEPTTSLWGASAAAIASSSSSSSTLADSLVAGATTFASIAPLCVLSIRVLSFPESSDRELNASQDPVFLVTASVAWFRGAEEPIEKNLVFVVGSETKQKRHGALLVRYFVLFCIVFVFCRPDARVQIRTAFASIVSRFFFSQSIQISSQARFDCLCDFFLSGFNACTFDFPFLLERARLCGLDRWDELGRMPGCGSIFFSVFSFSTLTELPPSTKRFKHIRQLG